MVAQSSEPTSTAGRAAKSLYEDVTTSSYKAFRPGRPIGLEEGFAPGGKPAAEPEEGEGGGNPEGTYSPCREKRKTATTVRSRILTSSQSDQFSM